MRITWKHVVGFLAISVLALLITLTGPWAEAVSTASSRASQVSPASSDLTASARSEAAPRCTRHAAGPDDAARSARPGDVVCFDGHLSQRRLVITKGGTPRHPIVYSGGGDAVDGITVEADDVVVEGFRAVRPQAPGVELTGDRITLRNTTVIGPRRGDGDGIRFFGDDLTIAHNTVRDTDNSGGRHADCMRTFADDTPAGHHAIGLAIHSTQARVGGNTLHAGIRYEVGIDASSRPGYEGSEPGGEP